jgi:hypothetical protein
LLMEKEVLDRAEFASLVENERDWASC